MFTRTVSFVLGTSPVTRFLFVQSSGKHRFILRHYPIQRRSIGVVAKNKKVETKHTKECIENDPNDDAYTSDDEKAEDYDGITLNKNDRIYDLSPFDMFGNFPILEAMRSLREPKRSKKDTRIHEDALSRYYHPGGTDDATTIALIFGGNKYGMDNIKKPNQDSAFVSCIRKGGSNNKILVSSVFDGHGKAGHEAALFARFTIEAKFLANYTHEHEKSDAVLPDFVKNVFLETDQELPEKIALDGGTTVSLVVQEVVTSHGCSDKGDDGATDTNIHFCNAGDSQSFLIASIRIPITPMGRKNMVVKNIVVFATRLDKPDIPEEKERIENTPGMSVEKSHDGKILAVFNGVSVYQSYNLAMSRALGNREAVGVIAEPIITNFKKNDIIKDTVKKVNSGCIAVNNSLTQRGSQKKHDMGKQTTCGVQITEENVKLFVVSATDGILDYMTPQEIADMIGPSLYSSPAPVHPIIAADDVLQDAIHRWDSDSKKNYRDDMTLVIATVL